MGDVYKKLSQGATPNQMSVTVYNRMIDIIRWYDTQRIHTGPGKLTGAVGDLDRVKIKNSSGAAVPWCGVLGINGPLYTPTDDADGFRRRPVLDGATPVAATHRGKWAVLLAPVGDDSVIDAAVSGVVPTRVYVNGINDQYCDVDSGHTDGDYTCYLGTGASGAQILYRENEGSGAGTVVWAVVRLGYATGPVTGMLKTSLTPGGTATMYLTNPDGTIIDESTPLVVTVKDTIGDKRAIGKDDRSAGGAMCTAEYLGDGTCAIKQVHQRAQRCSAILAADAGPGATVNVDNVVPLDGGMSPVNSSSDTLSATMPAAARSLDNATCKIEWDEENDVWKIYEPHEQARMIRGTLSAAMVSGTTTSVSITSPVACDGGQVPSGTMTGYNVFDWDADSGAEVLLVWNETTDHYEIIQVECPA